MLATELGTLQAAAPDAPQTAVMTAARASGCSSAYTPLRLTRSETSATWRHLCCGVARDSARWYAAPNWPTHGLPPDSELP